MDISKNPEKAKGVLQELIADFKDKRLTLKDIEPHERAKVCLALGTTYRYGTLHTRIKRRGERSICHCSQYYTS